MRVDQSGGLGVSCLGNVSFQALGQHWYLLSAPSNGVCHPQAADGSRVVCFSFSLFLLSTTTRAHLSPLPQDTQRCPPLLWRARGPGCYPQGYEEGTGRRSDWHITICTPTSLTVKIKISWLCQLTDSKPGS